MTIYDSLMAKAAEWPHIQEHPEGEMGVYAEYRFEGSSTPEWHKTEQCPRCQLEALAKQVCADALEQCRACSWADGLDMGTDRVVALDTMKEIIGGPLPESFVTTTETHGAGDLLTRRNNESDT